MSAGILEHPVVLRLKRIGLTAVFLLLLGFFVRPIESPAWSMVKSGQSELNIEQIEDSLGQGLVVGVLGGFRTIMADFAFIRMNGVWQDKDRVKLDAMIRLVTTLDPRPDFFWSNSARMVAYDVPNWRIELEGGYDAVPDDREYAINVEQAEQAFQLLERAREFHPENPKLYLDTAQIYLNRLKDIPKAAEWFRQAADIPGAPYYAARVYAQLLRQQGKNQQAYEYLVALFAELPDTPHAQKGIILERIRLLEDALRVPYILRFQSDGMSPVSTPGAVNLEPEP